MKSLILNFFATGLLISINLMPGYALAEISPLMQASLDQQLVKNSERYGVVGQSVVILKNHQPLYQGQHGFANIELGVTISKQHIFPSYSVTKLLTSVLMMQQVEIGSIELTHSIRTRQTTSVFS